MNAPTDMLELAYAARDRAYAPYSNFKVGAVVRAGSGRLYAGCNIENSAYPQGWCAEASAITAMVMAGERKIDEVLVLGDGPEPCTPCGGCRQKLWEFATAHTLVHMCSPGGLALQLTLGELLPHTFDASRLERP